MAARKAFSTPRLERDLPEIPLEKSSVAVLPRSQTSVQVARDVIETGKSGKALPDLPVSRIPSQIRHGIGFQGQPAYAPAPGQPPMTIIEEKEPSPEKKTTSIQRQMSLRPRDNNIPLQAANNESSCLKRDTSANPNHGNKPDPLPETWKHVIGTPSSFKKAHGGSVRKLEDMEDNDKKPVANTEKSPSRRDLQKLRLLLRGSNKPLPCVAGNWVDIQGTTQSPTLRG